jgi:DNA polymerase-1
MNAEQLEIALMPVIFDMEQRGVNLNGELLAKDYDDYFFRLDELDDTIQGKLGRAFDIDSNADLADAIQRRYPHAAFLSTPTGKRSTAKASLTHAISSVDPQLLGMLLVRSALATSVRTFIGPWNVQFQNHGRLYLKWNQFRNYTETGARTGRLSSSPNLQNIPVEWEALLAQLEKCEYVPPFPLPNIRQYIIPDSGKVFCGADYQAQEMRLLAHFAGGGLLESIQYPNHKRDIHQVAAEIAGITRRVAKTLGFAVLYGAGVARIAESLDITVTDASRIKARYLTAMPEIKRFSKETIDIGKARGAIETLGGRKYFTDPNVKIIGGRPVTFEYKLVNYKIQGSAADQTKKAMLDYYNMGAGELVLSVHDQLVAQEDAPSPAIQRAMEGSFQEILKYKVVADLECGFNFAAMQAEREFIANHIGAST